MQPCEESGTIQVTSRRIKTKKGESTMVLAKSVHAQHVRTAQPALGSRESQYTQYSMRRAAQAMLHTTRLQWAEPLHNAQKRSIEERLLDAA